jgi:bifunctional DNase/RNase
MNKPTIKLNMKLEEPIYIDENTVERVELETNTYFDEEKFVKDFGKE